MTTTFKISTLALALACSGLGYADSDSNVSTQADRGLYASVWGAANIPAGDWASVDGISLLGTGGAAGLDFGYRLNMFRLEGEVAYLYTPYKSFTIDGIVVDPDAAINTLNVMLNGYFDFYNSSAFTPYIGAGVGFSSYSISDNSVSTTYDAGNYFAVQGITGIEYHVNNNVGIAAEYRLKYSPLTDDDSNVTSTAFNNLIGLRLNYYF